MKRKPLFAALPLTLLIGLSSCGSSSPSSPEIVIKEKTLLDTPVISLNDKGQIECPAVENAEYYILEYLNEGTNKVKRTDVSSFPYTLEFKESGVYSVRVAAVPAENSIYNQSLFSDYLQMVSSVRTKLATPKNLKVVSNKKITFDKVANASRYQISIDEETFETKETSYEYDFLPGTSYSIKVKAVIDENIFLLSSDWSDSYSFKYTLAFSKPSGLAISSIGQLSWSCSTYSETTGFTVKAVNKSTNEAKTFTTLNKKLHLTSLPEGSYEVSVMANGIGDNPGSAYSSSVSLKLEDAACWKGSELASFTGLNGAKGVYSESEGATSMRCKEGWGGLFTTGATVDFNKSPVLHIDYKEILFGYMGAYYYDGPTANPTAYYQGDVYLSEKASDVELVYNMKKDLSGNAISRASGVVNNLYLTIGYTNAPAVSNTEREVAKLRSVRIVYVTVL